MLASVGCTAGPKFCGANNEYAEDDAEFCGAGAGCSYNEWIDWEGCTDVAPWQCFVECDEGEVLSPLRYCDCIPEAELYDMFCDPEPVILSRVASSEPEPVILSRVASSEPLIVRPSFDIKPPVGALPIIDITTDVPIFAGLGEVCGGFNELTGEPFPRCERGLVCEDGGFFSIPGAGNICKDPSTIILAGLGETCEGFDELTG